MSAFTAAARSYLWVIGVFALIAAQTISRPFHFLRSRIRSQRVLAVFSLIEDVRRSEVRGGERAKKSRR